MTSSEPDPVRVAIANDYPVVIAGLHAMLDGYADVVAMADLLPGPAPIGQIDIVLYDTFAAQELGGERLQELVGRYPKVVLFSWHIESDAVARALGTGACGYLAKSLSPNEVVGAIVEIHRGARVVKLGRGQDNTRHDSQARWPGEHAGLTPRESEILAYITQGLSNDEISARTFIGLASLKGHIRSLYRKVGVTRRPHAIIWGVENGFHAGGHNA